MKKLFRLEMFVCILISLMFIACVGCMIYEASAMVVDDVLTLPDYYEDYDDVNVYIPEDVMEPEAMPEVDGQMSLLAVGGEPGTQDPTGEGTTSGVDYQVMGFGIVAGALMGASFIFQWKPGVV